MNVDRTKTDFLQNEPALCQRERRITLFSRVLASFGLVLICVSWKLWTPQSIFPQIPFLGSLVNVPGSIDWLLLTGCLVGLLVMALSRSSTTSINPRRISATVFAVSAIGLVLLDQNRLQPWMYQFIVFAVLLMTCSARTSLNWMRWIVVSVYLFSSISKFDYQFIHTVGEQMLTTLTGFVGLESSAWSEPMKAWAVATLPLGELLVGVGLLIPKTRLIVGWFAVALHLTLVIVLGPFGLGHRPTVLIWNLFFVAQAVLLFILPLPQTEKPSESNSKSNFEFVGVLVALFVLLFPLTRPIGICDHWPAWEVYAPRSSRARLVATAPATDENPVRNDWHDIPRWSLTQIGVPVYPQARVQLAIAIAAIERESRTSGLRIEILSESDRWTGVRETQLLTDLSQAKMAASRYRLNTEVRQLWFAPDSK